MVLESGKSPHHSRNSKGTEDSKKRAKKEYSKNTPKDSRTKKESARPKKVKGRTSTSRGSSYSSKGKHKDQEVEVVGELLNTSEEIIEF